MKRNRAHAYEVDGVNRPSTLGHHVADFFRSLLDIYLFALLKCALGFVDAKRISHHRLTRLSRWVRAVGLEAAYPNLRAIGGGITCTAELRGLSWQQGCSQENGEQEKRGAHGNLLSALRLLMKNPWGITVVTLAHAINRENNYDEQQKFARKIWPLAARRFIVIVRNCSGDAATGHIFLPKAGRDILALMRWLGNGPSVARMWGEALAAYLVFYGCQIRARAVQYLVLGLHVWMDFDSRWLSWRALRHKFLGHICSIEVLKVRSHQSAPILNFGSPKINEVALRFCLRNAVGKAIAAQKKIPHPLPFLGVVGATDACSPAVLQVCGPQVPIGGNAQADNSSESEPEAHSGFSVLRALQDQNRSQRKCSNIAGVSHEFACYAFHRRLLGRSVFSFVRQRLTRELERFFFYDLGLAKPAPCHIVTEGAC